MTRYYYLKSRTALWPVIVIFLFAGSVFGTDKDGSYYSIEKAYQSGLIGYEEKLVRQVGSIFSPPVTSTAGMELTLSS